jgi:acyl-[acyl-carrier-protein]-phospholipid O-acyltransferase / long-chain-fatty-acid--[acyl-carrier-protein] ligase
MAANNTIPKRLLMAAAAHRSRNPIIFDELGKSLTFDRLIIGCAVLSKKIEALTHRTHVGCLLPNSVTGIVATFGCNFAHKTAVILNYTFPLPTILRCCERAHLDVLLTSRQFLEKSGLSDLPDLLSTHQIRTVFLEDLAKEIGRLAKLRGMLRVRLKRLQTERSTPDDAAVILFTSGSEAEPKAVVLTHRNLLSNCGQILEAFPIGKHEVMFSALPHFHAFGLTAGAILPLLNGMKTVIGLSPLRHRENLQMIRTYQATVLLSTDTFLAQMFKVATPDDLVSLRFVVAGAERLKPRTRELYEGLGITMLEGYGATEAGPVIAVNVPGASRHGTVGRFLPQIEYRIEPHDGIEEGGVLHVRGPNMMKSYLHDLLESRSSLDDGWYDTGDIVTLDDDGFLAIKGRKKRFTKIAGEMISLGYIEDEISRISPDHQHAAIAIESDAQSKTLIRLYTNDDALTLEAIRLHFGESRIPNTYLPRELIHMAELPVLRTGKVDYQTLQKHLNQLP